MRVRLWGVPIDLVDGPGAVERVRELAASGRSAVVTTPNPEILVRSRSAPDLRQVLAGADLALPDGIGIVLALRLLLGLKVDRVAGVDLADGLLRCGDPGLRVFMLGARPGVAERAAEAAAVMGAEVTGTHHGYFPPCEDDRVASLVAASGANLLLVGMGSPRQELWIDHNRTRLGTLCSITVGGTLDVLAGESVRAPLAWRRLGLEWLYRAVREPARWRRMGALFAFAALVVLDWIRRRCPEIETGGGNDSDRN